LLRTIVKEAKTVDEALRLALEELGIDKEHAQVEVINEGNKGILGFIGNRNAIVRVTELFNMEDTIQAFLKPIFDKMGISAEMDIEYREDSIQIKLSGDNIGIVIGRRGETLDALQYLLSLIINKNTEQYTRVVLDVADYRSKREETLQRLARRVAEKVAKTRRNITLEPMNPYERRIIHSTLQEYKNIDTQSIGEEPNRKVVIRFKQGNARA
jgi:spoIIIJ-associated protein